MKIAVFLPNWIGDAVMATPALRAIRQEFVSAEITAIMRPYVAEVLDGLDLVDYRVLDHSKPAKGVRGLLRKTGDLAGTLRFVQSLRREKFDVVLLLPNSFRTAWLAWLAGAKRRVGFDRDGRGWLLTDPVPPKPKSIPHPVVDEYLRLAEHLGCTRLSRQMELAVLPADEQRLRQFWLSHDERLRSRDVVCLNPGGAFGAAKHWPTASFGELARRIATELDRTVLVLCGPQERAEAGRIVAGAAHPNVVSLGECPGADEWPLSIGLTKAAVKHSELLVTTDSGPRHFAPPFDVSVVTLFGPTHIAWSETYCPKSVHLQIDVDCGPCQKPTCAFDHHRCMRDLAVGDVFAAVASLESTRARNPAA